MSEPIYLNPPRGGWPKGEGPPTAAALKSAAGEAKASYPPAAGTRFAGLQRGSVRQRGKMNRTEQKWADQLDADLAAGLIKSWAFESMKLRIVLPGDGVRAKWFTPDFLVVERDGTERLDEVKGSGPDDAASILRLRVAADAYPNKKFRLVKQQKPADGGGWKVTEL